MSRDSQRYRKTYSYYRVQPKTEMLEVIVDETLDWKKSVRVASTTSISLAGSTPLTIDGVVLVDEDRVLLKDQGSGTENGIYYFEVSNGSYIFTRAPDARQDTINCGATTYAEEGAVNSGKFFIMSTTGPITVGTTAMSWALFSGGGVGGSGTTNYVSKFTAPNEVGNSIIYDNSTGIGIGTSSFSGRFYVSGSSTASQQTAVIKGGVHSPTGNAGILDIQNASGTSILFVTGTLASIGGRVGIGTNRPSALLHVSGTYNGSSCGIKIGEPNVFGVATNTYTSLQHTFYGSDGLTQRLILGSNGNILAGGDLGFVENTARFFVSGSSVSSNQGIVYKAGVPSPAGPLLDIKDYEGNSIVFISGSGLSGSLTRLTDGSRYLIAGNNVEISTGSNGAVTIDALGSLGGGGTTSFIPKFTAGSTLGDSILQEGLGVNYTGTSSTAFLTSSGYGITFTYPQIWSFPDNAFALNIDGKFRFDTGGSGEGLLGIGTGPEHNLHIVHSTAITSNPINNPSPIVIKLQNSNTTANNSTAIVNGDGNGGEVNTFIQFINVDHGANKGALSFGTRDGASSGERLRIDEAGNVGIGSVTPTSIGTDAFLFVSGSRGALGTATRGVAAFGGDMVVSGSLRVGTGSLLITSNDIQFGMPSLRIEKNGNDMKFFDINNAAGLTLSSLASGVSGLGGSGTAGTIPRWGAGSPSTTLTDSRATDDGTTFVVGSGAYAGAALPGGMQLKTTTPIYVATDGTRTTIVGTDGTTACFVGSLTNHNFQIRASNATAITVKPTGEVGIGTASPAFKLEVAAGAASAMRLVSDSGTATVLRLLQTANRDWGIRIPASSTSLSFYDYSAGQERMVIDLNGNVGIGTASPAFKLDVNGSIRAVGNVDATGYSVYAALVGTTTVQTTNTLTLNATAASSQIVFQTNNTERARINSSGNVGIGTSTVAAGLHVYSSLTDEVARFESGVNPYISLYGSSVRQGYFYSNSSSVELVAENKPLYLQGATEIRLRTNISVDRVVINSGGVVGINNVPASSTSVSKLIVEGDITLAQANKSLLGNLYYDTATPGFKYTGNGYGWGFREDNAGKLQMLRAGNNSGGPNTIATPTFNDLFTFDLVNNYVGLGTETPGTKFHIYGSTSDMVRITQANNAAWNRIYFQKPTRSWSFGQTNGNDFVLADESAGQYRFTVDILGNIAIGPNSANARLHIQGSTNGATPTLLAQHSVANGSSLPVLDVQNSAGNSLFYVSGSGFVGIGTSTASLATNLLKSLGGNVLSIAGPSASSLLFEVNGNLSGTIITSDSGMSMIPGTNRALSLGSDNGIKLSIDIDGDVALQTSERYFDASIFTGQGIKLRSSPGNSDPQVLDSYYEKDLIVTLKSTNNDLVCSLYGANQTLKFTRIGRMITISGYIQVEVVDATGSGRLYVDLGTTVGERPSLPSAVSLYINQPAAAVDWNNPVVGYVDSGTSRIYIDRYEAGQGMSNNLTLSQFVVVDQEIMISVSYSTS